MRTMARNKASAAQSSAANGTAYAGAYEYDAKVDKKLLDLQKQLESAQARLATAATRLDEAQKAFTTAQSALDAAEVKHLAGSMDDRDFGRFTTARDNVKRTLAQATLEHGDAERLVRLMPAAIEEARQAAQMRVRDNLRRATAEKAAKLAALLTEAKQASDDLLALREQAEAQFPVDALLQLGCGGLMAAHDLGEQGGFTVRAAGIPPLYSPWLTNDRARNQPSMYDIWLQEVERYLALSVEQRAEADRQSRVNSIANAEQARKDDLVKQALWERWNKLQPYSEFQPLIRNGAPAAPAE
jgi:hypothetical protein